MHFVRKWNVGAGRARYEDLLFTSSCFNHADFLIIIIINVILIIYN